MRRLNLVVLLLMGTALGQTSKTTPRWSLTKLNQIQCSYAVSVINHVTHVIDLIERGQLNKASLAWPNAPQEKLDYFVMNKADILRNAPEEFAGVQLTDLSKPRELKQLERTKLRIIMEQTDFAYVLELRGCIIERNDVSFVKWVYSAQ